MRGQALATLLKTLSLAEVKELDSARVLLANVEAQINDHSSATADRFYVNSSMAAVVACINQQRLILWAYGHLIERILGIGVRAE